MNKKKQDIIILICAITIILCVVSIGIIAAFNRTNSRFSLNKHLDDTIVTIKHKDNTYEYTLDDFAYYILLMEATINHSATLFNPNNLYALWNMKSDGSFVKDAAKELTMDLFIRDCIYYNEAIKAHISLDEAEIDTVYEEASYIYKNLTGKQVDATEYDLQDLYNIRYKINIIVKYINTLKAHTDYADEDLDIDGAYYTDLSRAYSIDIDNLWNQIELGDLTISRD